MESSFGGSLWGLNWKSPTFMHQLDDQLRVVKFILVICAIYLLTSKSTVISHTIQNVFYRRAFVISAFVLAVIQLPFLYLGILLEGVSSSNLDYIHKEKSFGERAIYVYTADSGAVGRAYHYFYVKCPLPLNRYELTKITTTNWMKSYSFDVVDNQLIIEDKSKNGEVKTFDISRYRCR